ncbi:hypothetical protein ACH4GK_42170 [Streptomyces rimosus]|uniref:hypothetical protein n=1 Tax=Streptomyces rimosus TaxID=1927 RepID=UPI000A55B897|nr:hypothetical protein [Streptomyces rimosus]
MTQSKFDKQVEESAETLAFGIGRFLAGRAWTASAARTRRSSVPAAGCCRRRKAGSAAPPAGPGGSAWPSWAR